MNQYNSGSFPENGNYNPSPQGTGEGFDLKGILLRYLRGWYWFVLCLGVGLTAAWVYIQYTEPVYSVRSTLIIRDDGSKTGFSENFVVADFGFRANVDFNSELEILNSTNLMRQVVDSLNLHIRYYREGNLRDGELYNNSPVILSNHFPIPAAYQRTIRFRIKDDQSFVLLRGDNDTTLVNFGNPFRLGPASFTVDRLNNVKPDEIYYIKLQNPESTAKGFTRNLVVSRVNDYSQTISITIQDPVTERAKDIILALIDLYDSSIIDEKNRVGQQTMRFINERLGYVTNELYSVEEEIETFKREKEVPLDLSETAGRYLQQYRDSDKEIIELDLRLKFLNDIEEQFLADTARTNPLPVASEAFGGILTGQIQAYNNKIADRNRILAVATPNNPIAQRSRKEMEQLESNILLSLANLKRELQTRRDQIKSRLVPVEERLDLIPSDQREFLQIMRQQQIKENLFTYLLQKREETALSLAAQVPNTRIIESPSTRGLVFPDPNRAYMMAILLSLLLPASVLTIRELLNNKIFSPEDLRQYTTIPFLGVIGLSKEKDSIVVRRNSRSALAEMFRSLRTNLQFMAAGRNQQVILITSTFSGEGKTFITVNLGMSLALSGKKTLLLGFDLRKPKLNQYLMGKRAAFGLSNFFATNAELDSLVQQHELNENLFFISCGPIPPNPAELISSDKVISLFSELRKKYDYILIDSPPVGLVTDPFLLGQHADSSILVTRSGQTRIEDVQFLEEIHRKRQIPNIGIVLSGHKATGTLGRYGHRYQYGYYDGYYEDGKKGWIQSIKSKIN